MAFQLSPGVSISEVDLTTVVPSVATTVGGIAGPFEWGPVDEITIITDELQLVDKFGKPGTANTETFFTAANFLSYGSDLRVVRAISSDAKNASGNVGGTAGVLIKNSSAYTNSVPANTHIFVAKYPGTLGTGLKVSMADYTSFDTWQWKDYFDTKPNTSPYASTKQRTKDELHIVVIDDKGNFGAANTVLERFAHVSKAKDAKGEDGSSIYYADVLNKKSKYIWFAGHPTANIINAGASWGIATNLGSGDYDAISTDPTITLASGTLGGAANVSTSYQQFKSPDAVDVSLLMAGAPSESEYATVINNLLTIASNRKDCLVLFSQKKSDVVDKFGSEQSSISTSVSTISDSNYGVMDCNWKYQFDRYNDRYVWTPLNGDIAGLCVYTDAVRDPWFSPAGVNRGVIKNVVKLAWNPTQAERDLLYKASINPVVSFAGEGTILYGDKTYTKVPTSMNRINVRRLFIVLEKAIARAARSTLFEFNDEFTRAAFVNLVEPYLRDVQGRRGIYEYRVVCDTTNNTPEVIDRNEFVGDIYIKPARSVNFIRLNFVAVRTGVAFEEIVGRF
jgi:hypothetical protein